MANRNNRSNCPCCVFSTGTLLSQANTASLLGDVSTFASHFSRRNLIRGGAFLLGLAAATSAHNSARVSASPQPQNLSAAQGDEELITVFVAREIITMDPTRPTATAVAVRGKHIISVGSLEDLEPWLDHHPHTIDEQFKDKVLMPGLIDPHLHPLLGAVQFATTWITPEAWSLHDGEVPATTSQEQYRSRLVQALEDAKDDGKPIFMTWGWQRSDHGPMTRSILNELSPDRPVMILQRSVHEAVFNTAALDFLEVQQEDAVGFSDTEVIWEDGHFIEAGLFDLVLPKLAGYLLSPAVIDPAFERNSAYLHSGGITTTGDLATGQVSWNLELGAFQRNLIDPDVPFRTVIIPTAYHMSLAQGGLDASFEFIDAYLATDPPAPQLVHGKRIKLFADGAMFSQLMQLREPGYIDGHDGEWITPLDEFEALAHKYWNEGYRIHVHANGDRGIEYTLEVFEKLQAETPRQAGALVFEHYGYSDDILNRRVADFGALVSANPYYLTALADTYTKTLGTDRGSRITPLSGLVDRGVPVTLHSDFGMAPARPLFLAWSAITRQTWNGNTYAPPRGLTLDEALKAITIDAAYVLGLDSELGSIQSGKIADFAVLDNSPYEVSIDALKDIGIWGTVFEGVPRPVTA